MIKKGKEGDRYIVVMIGWGSCYWIRVSSTICMYNSSHKDIKSKLKRVLDDIMPQFKNGIGTGTHKHIKDKMVFQENVTSKFHKAHLVLYSPMQER